MQEQIEKEPLVKEGELPIFTKWLDFVKWLFPMTDKLPKKVRFSITNRMNNLALDIVEDLIDARYSRERYQILRSTNLKLEKIRVLIRLCLEQQFIAHSTYRFAVKNINDTGKMLGGWKNSLTNPEKKNRGL